MVELTIITPTYNRENTLSATFMSLCNQTRMDFLWMVVDDGSVDNTEVLIKEYREKAPFEICYYKKSNGGKARAINYALARVDTKYCVCLDSDDTFSETAVEKALNLLCEDEENEKCCGIIGLRHNPDQTVMGGKEIPKSYKYITIVDIYNECKIKSEFITFYKTNIVKKFRFPEIDGEKFIPPSWFHYTLSENHYVFRTTWDVLCYCEYIRDGLTKNKRNIIIKNPIGYTLIKRMSFKNSKGLKRKFKNSIMYVCGCIISKDKNWLKNAPYKMVAIISCPLSLLIYYKKYRKKN